ENGGGEGEGMDSRGAGAGTVTGPRTRRRNSAGEHPTWRLNNVLNDPREMNPTSKQTSVTDLLVTVSRWRARSRRRRVWNSLGVSPQVSRKERSRCPRESPATSAPSA